MTALKEKEVNKNSIEKLNYEIYENLLLFKETKPRFLNKKELLWHAVQNDLKIGITGISGVGKTTLYEKCKLEASAAGFECCDIDEAVQLEMSKSGILFEVRDAIKKNNPIDMEKNLLDSALKQIGMDSYHNLDALTVACSFSKKAMKIYEGLEDKYTKRLSREKHKMFFSLPGSTITLPAETLDELRKNCIIFCILPQSIDIARIIDQARNKPINKKGVDLDELFLIRNYLYKELGHVFVKSQEAFYLSGFKDILDITFNFTED